MATISSLGIGSGLDSESIVTKLAALERQPLKALQTKATLGQAKITAFGQVQSQFSALSEAAAAISTAGAWKTTKASSSNSAAATITSTSTAAAQSFTLDVDRLAQRQSLTSTSLASAALVGVGTLTFRLGAWSNTGGQQSAAATLAAANAALSLAQNGQTTAAANKSTKDADLVVATQAVMDADALLVAPTTTRDTALTAYISANSVYQPLKADQLGKSAAYTVAQTAFLGASTIASNSAAVLASANASLASVTLASTNSNADLAASVISLANAGATSTAANSALGLADSSLANANSKLGAANTSVISSTTLLGNANTARDGALQADSDAKAALNSFVTTDAAALANPDAAAYSTAYGEWVDAVATTSSSYTQVNLDAVATKKVILDNKRSALAASMPDGASILAAANVITAPADSTDASGLILAANGAQSALTSANALVITTTAEQAVAVSVRSLAYTDALTATTNLVNAQDVHTTAYSVTSSATAALGSATASQASASSAKATADAALSAAASVRDNALIDLNSANAVLVTPESDLAAAQVALDQANADLLPFSSARSAALSAQALATSAAALAQTVFDNASAAVTAAQAQVTAATNGVTSATPAFTAAAVGEDIGVTATAADTLSTLAIKINAANAGVVATVFSDGANQRLILTSKDTGTAAGFRVQVSDTGDGANTDNAGLSRFGFDPETASFGYANSGVSGVYGQDAQVRINGAIATSKTNTFTDNVPGVTISVLSATTTNLGSPSEARSSVAMTVSEDVTPAVKSVNDFVTAYNTLVSNLTDLTKYDAVTKTPSAFQGDSAVVGLLNILRNMVSSISEGSVYKRLSDVGIQVQRNGTLSINTTKLSVAANNGNELRDLFITDNKNAQTNGFALKLAAFGKGVLATGGSVSNKAKALDKDLQVNSVEQQRINDRAAVTEARLRKQYSALDAKMASLSALNAYVSQQVTTWNKSTG